MVIFAAAPRRGKKTFSYSLDRVNVCMQKSSSLVNSTPKFTTTLTYALLAPLAAVLAASVLEIHDGWSLPRTLLSEMLEEPLDPIHLGIITCVCLVSFDVVDRWGRGPLARIAAFCACVCGFAILFATFTPRLSD